MARNPLRKAHAVPVFTDAFLATVQMLQAAITKTRNVSHKGTKGSMRESPLAEFFRGQLPQIYGVTSGEAVDLENQPGPQLDVLFYDRTRNFPFVSESASVLPAEALLASIEVKSKLTASEAAASVAAARRLRRLRPFKSALAGPDIKDPNKSKKQARYFHCLFAYDTDLADANWPLREYHRFRSKENAERHDIDIVYVLGRGLLNLTERKSVLEDDKTAHALTIFYFSILNFLDRESRRRGPTPYSSYAAKMGGIWRRIPDS